MQNATKFFILIALLLPVFTTGCGENVKFRNPFVKETKKPDPKPIAKQPTPTPVKKKQQSKEDEALQLMYRTATMRRGARTFGTGNRSDAAEPRIGVAQAMERISTELENSIDFAPTLVVWVVDSTDSASSLRQDFVKAANKAYTNFKANGFKSGTKSPDALTTSIVSFGAKTTFVTAAPTASLDTAISKFEEIPSDSSGKELTFAAVQEVLDKYGDYRTKQNKELMIVLVTDEAGDDQHKLDAVITQAKQIGARIHAVGTPAPLGQKTPTEAESETRSDGLPAIVRGPETRHQQRVSLDFGSSRFATEEIDSGYGPFALNFLCRSSGGAYIIAKSGGSSWPASATRFEDAKMRNYPPQYLSEQDYQAKLTSNAALKALHDASKLAKVEAMSYAASTFTVGDEARLKNALDGAQRVAARLEPPTSSLFDVLDKGEKDRDKITDKRWQVSFDLAYGRAGAAKCRVEGYNQMLAILKGGRKFNDPNNDTWYLLPADTLKEAGSRLEKVRAKSKMYLERIVKEHPGTPWAYLAQKELETPLGWEWSEQSGSF